MKSLLNKLFLEHWQRKGTSLLLAIIIWLVVNQNLTTSKSVSDIPIRVINIPPGRTIQGLQGTGQLKRRLAVTLTGNNMLINDLTSGDIEVVIDASDKQAEWNPTITPKNLISLNPEIDLTKSISKIYHHPFTIRPLKLVTERIPIVVTKPIGDAPRDYQFLDIWPYTLMMTVTGAEDVIKRIQSKEIKLSFNLNEISKVQLDRLSPDSEETDVISYFVPESWKQISLPLISDSLIEINDPSAKNLRIDFIRCDLFPIEKPLPITLFFPQKHLDSLHPNNYSFASSSFLNEINGLHLTSQPLFTKGVSHLFLQIVQDMLKLEVIVSPKMEGELLEWSTQFINPRYLEDLYISTLLSGDSIHDDPSQSSLREEYLRNRFRNYMNRFQLYNVDGSKFELKAKMQSHKVSLNS